jgi:hypothetical protein
VFHLRRIFGPGHDLLFVESCGGRDEAGTILTGFIFRPVEAIRPEDVGRGLGMQIEVSPAWLLVEEIAARLGPASADVTDNSFAVSGSSVGQSMGPSSGYAADASVSAASNDKAGGSSSAL